MMETVDTAAARVRLHNLLIEYSLGKYLRIASSFFIDYARRVIDLLLMSIKRSCAVRRESGLECNLQRPTIINKYMYTLYTLYSNICCV